MKKWIDYIWVWCWVLVVNNNDEVLLLKRTSNNSSGASSMWARPGGGVDFGETMEGAMKREVYEEVWLEVELFWWLYYTDDIREENGTKYHWATAWTFWKVVWWELTNMEPEKHECIEWFSLDNLPDNIVEYTAVWIAQYREYLNSQ